MNTAPAPAESVRDGSPEVMSLRERLTFACGDIFGGGSGALFSVLYFFFLTDVVGLAASWAGVVTGIAKVWEALAKPLAGQISDNTRTRWGRRRPYLMVGAGAILLVEMLLWLPPQWLDSQLGKALWSTVAVVAYVTTVAFVVVPYTSLSTETTPNTAERSRVNLYRLVASAVASSAVFIIATGLMATYKKGEMSVTTLYLTIAVGFGLLFAIPIAAVGFGVRERTPMPTHRARFSVSQLVSGLRVPAFRSLLGMYLCAGLMMDVVAATVMAYATYVAPISPAIFMAILIVVNLAAVAVIQTRLAHVSKNVVYGTLLPVAIVAMVVVALWPASWPTAPVYLAVALLAVGASGSQMMPWVMFPDVVDAAELQFGDRRSGSLSSLMSLIRNLCTAVLVMVVGVILQLSGYHGKLNDKTATEQPGSAIWAIRLVMLGAVVVFLAIGWVLARRYPLTHEVTVRNADELTRRRGVVVD